MSCFQSVFWRQCTVFALAAGLLPGVSHVFADDKPAAKPVPAKKAVAAGAPVPAKTAADQKAAAKKADSGNEKKVTKDRTKKTAPANLLQKLIRNIFGGLRKPAGWMIPKADPDGQPPAADSARKARDQIDLRIPYDRRLAVELRKAETLMEERKWKSAMLVLQYVLDKSGENGDTLIRLPGGELVSLREQAIHLLGRFPEPQLDQYRLEHGETARRMLSDALQRGAATGIVEVVDKHFHTMAGHEACNILGTQHFDRGEFGLAARRFRRLLEANAQVTQDPRWRLKAAFAFRESGNTSESDRLLKEMPTQGGGLEIGGLTVDPGGWLNQTESTGPSPSPVLDEWLMVYGSPSRTGTVVGGDPLLLPRWSHPSTNNQTIREQIELLTQDLGDQRRATIPTFFPLMVDDKVIFRTLRGVQVVEARTGKALWETREGISAERVLSGQRFSQYQEQVRFGGFGGGFAINGPISSYRGNGAEQHPLTGLLFRNGTYGVLSSDGRQLFAIEDQALLSRRQPGAMFFGGPTPNRNDSFRRDWNSNKLTSYDLKTGRPLWEIGGTQMNETFDLPLAGTYFFGVPVPDGGELFVVGEKQGEIRLFSLEPETGQEKWSQVLAISDVKIEQDFGRRWWNAQVAVGGGVLVCPTTAGWLVGVDRMNHSVLWAYRYSKPGLPQPGRPGESVVPLSSLGSRWCPSAPVVVDNLLVYTPPGFSNRQSQQSSVVCLDLFDGKPLWQKPKGSFLYLAGVFDDRVVLVGKESMTAISLADGGELWTLPISKSFGPPVGQGVATSSRYHLPLQSGELWTVDLMTGKVVSKTYLPAGEGPLGNLAMYRGMLLSLGPLGLRSFEQRDAIETEIRRRKAKNPTDWWALLREAEIHVLNRDYVGGLALLRQIRPGDVPEDQTAHFRARMTETFSSLLRDDFQSHDAVLEQFLQFVRTPNETLQSRRLSAERHDARGEYEAAFAGYWALGEEDGSHVVNRRDDPQISLPLALWLAGRMRDLWLRMPESARTMFEKRISESAEQALDGDNIAGERFVSLFAFHPSSVAVRRKLAEAYAASGNFVRAENDLLKLTRLADPRVAGDAVLRLAHLMLDRGLDLDAGHYYEILLGRFSETELAGGKTGIQIFNEFEASRKSAAESAAVSWADFDLKLQRSGTGYSSERRQQLGTNSFQMPYFRNYRFEFDRQQQQLAVRRVSDGSLYWLVPLRSSARSVPGNSVAAQAARHQLFVLHRGVLHCLSPVERKVLWTRTIETHGRSSASYRAANQQDLQPMQSGSNVVARYSLARQAVRQGMLAVANSDYVCLYGRRSFTVLDATTGEVRWTHDDVPANTMLYGSQDAVYMVPPDRRAAAAFRAHDARPLNIPEIGRLLSKTIWISGNQLVLVESSSLAGLFGLSGAATVIRGYNPLSKKEHWKQQFPAGSYFSVLEDGHLVVLRTEGALLTVNLDSGTINEFGEVPQADLMTRSDIYVLNDRDNLYLVVNHPRRSGVFSSDGLRSVRVNGPLFAFDRRTHKPLWKQTVTDQNLPLYSLNSSPVLTFVSRSYVRQGALNYWSLKILAIDKQTGRRLIDTQAPFNSSFRSIDVNLSEHYIELRSYGQRIRLIAVDRTTASSK